MTKTRRRRAVVTNDDGIGCEGLRLLAIAAQEAGLDVVVAAPDHDASGTSAAMTAATTEGRVVVTRHNFDGLEGTPVYAVRAAPAFIAFTATRGAFGGMPDVVLSGINRGPNTGQAVLHSGTVGAAMTAATSQVPSAAFSLDVRAEHEAEHWDAASAAAAQVLPSVLDLPPGLVLNVNIPNVPPASLRGIRQATLAGTGAVQLSIVAETQDYLQVTMAEAAERPQPGTDSALIAAGYVTVTALRPVCDAGDVGLPWPAPDGRASRQRITAAGASAMTRSRSAGG
ncbi:MAG TPA: 5'/3'-nucleotidase SurE [Streptosporangiaceae bacterium]